jgi:NADH-quinone oxidoreductase subunit K
MLKLIITELEQLSHNKNFFITLNSAYDTGENLSLVLLPSFSQATYFNEALLPSTYINLIAFVFLLYTIGLFGLIYNRKNFFIAMMGIEIMYLAIILGFIIISVATSNPEGQIYALFFLVIAAAESALGLAILIVLYKFDGSIKFDTYTELRG